MFNDDVSQFLASKAADSQVAADIAAPVEVPVAVAPVKISEEDWKEVIS